MSLINYMSWDIEIHKVLPEDCKNIMEHRPLGISCIAMTTSDDMQTSLYCAGSPEKPLARKMNTFELVDFVEEMWAGYESGYHALAWNGNFDFQILLEELDGRYETEIKLMVLNSVDPMFHLFCIKGYPISLKSAAEGMHVEGKTEGMSGALAPAMWQESEEGRFKVLEYVAQDTIVPIDLIRAIDKLGLLEWESRSGRFQLVRMDPNLTVKEAMKIPEPDTSWMSDPMPRSQFYGWAIDKAQLVSEMIGVDAETVQKVLDALQKI